MTRLRQQAFPTNRHPAYPTASCQRKSSGIVPEATAVRLHHQGTKAPRNAGAGKDSMRHRACGSRQEGGGQARSPFVIRSFVIRCRRQAATAVQVHHQGTKECRGQKMTACGKKAGARPAAHSSFVHSSFRASGIGPAAWRQEGGGRARSPFVIRSFVIRCRRQRACRMLPGRRLQSPCAARCAWETAHRPRHRLGRFARR